MPTISKQILTVVETGERIAAITEGLLELTLIVIMVTNGAMTIPGRVLTPVAIPTVEQLRSQSRKPRQFATSASLTSLVRL